jgi:tRNA pseudouridine55 synthase
MRPPPADRSVEDLLGFGVLALDKPAGPSSHQVSAWARDLAGVQKAAHTGTLDPKVTGCLPVLLGDATRIAGVLLGPKTYVAVLELHESPPADLEAVLAEFEGPIHQKPPRKSAVTRELRVREIHDLTLLEAEGRKLLLSIRCEGGTYVRTLCHDLGLALGTGANMGDLRRVGTIVFDDRDLVTLHDFVDALAVHEEGEDAWIREVVDPAERALAHLPAVTIAPSAAREVAEGAPVYAPGVIDADETGEGEMVACYTPGGSVVCLGTLVGDPGADSGMVIDLDAVLV